MPLEIFGRVKKGLDPTLNAISTVFILFTVVLVIVTELIKRGNAPALAAQVSAGAGGAHKEAA